MSKENSRRNITEEKLQKKHYRLKIQNKNDEGKKILKLITNQRKLQKKTGKALIKKKY